MRVYVTKLQALPLSICYALQLLCFTATHQNISTASIYGGPMGQHSIAFYLILKFIQVRFHEVTCFVPHATGEGQRVWAQVCWAETPWWVWASTETECWGEEATGRQETTTGEKLLAPWVGNSQACGGNINEKSTHYDIMKSWYQKSISSWKSTLNVSGHTQSLVLGSPCHSCPRERLTFNLRYRRIYWITRRSLTCVAYSCFRRRRSACSTRRRQQCKLSEPRPRESSWPPPNLARDEVREKW